MKIKIKRYKTKYVLDYLLIMITPIIDTINGIYIIKHGATGFSLGTVYRLLLLIYVIIRLFKKKALILHLIPLIYFPIVGIVRGGINIFNCLTYAFKWILPIVLILHYAFNKEDKLDIKLCLLRTLDFWSVFVPVSLIIEYFLKLGESSYYDAGFKGLYYSTNDIALVLIVCFIYTLWKSFYLDKKNIVWSLLNFISIVILSTKSSLIFAIISFIYILLSSKKVKVRYIIYFIMLFMFVWKFTGISILMTNFVNRYSNMWDGISGGSLINRFLIFATSGRTLRINTYFNEINTHGNYLINLFFGWVIPDNAHVIEMDWHDLTCQYGIIGFIVLIFEYGTFFLKCNHKVQPFWYITLICLIYSLLAGHVISGAFSGTAFALVFSLLLLESREFRKF